jgi:hypothetical protein
MVFYVLVVLLVAGLGLIAPAQNKPKSRPSSVAEEMWIPLSDNSGIALNWHGGLPDGSHDPAVIYGTLMVKTAGVWQKAYLEPVPLNGGIMPIR